MQLKSGASVYIRISICEKKGIVNLKCQEMEGGLCSLFTKEKRLDFANEICLSVKFLPRSENV